VTGDHRSHNFIHTSSSLYERLAVPLLIYNGRLHLDEAASDAICGSHLDIGPTLVELAAPSGFVYHSLGDDLLDPNRPQTGIGQKAMITPETVISMTGEMQQLSFGGAADDAGKGTLPLEASREWADHAVRYLKDYYAQAWWRIMKGPDLPIGSQ
jgi:phosphoglycerol transferase MdoB-like AlkP superfamily enzyme